VQSTFPRDVLDRGQVQRTEEVVKGYLRTVAHTPLETPGRVRVSGPRIQPCLSSGGGNAPAYKADQRIQQEGREPRPRDGDRFHALQFRPDPPDPALQPGHGGMRHYEAVGTDGHGESIGGLGSARRLRCFDIGDETLYEIARIYNVPTSTILELIS
jgi:hypothetical protein